MLIHLKKLVYSRIVDPSRAPGVGMIVKRVHTQRRCAITAEYYAVQDLRARAAWCLATSPLALLIAKDLLTRAPVVRLADSPFFRARPSTEVGAGGWAEMGPPPRASRAGRYNRRGHSVLYLSSTRAGVRAEIAAAALCIQEYRLPNLRIVDLAREDLSDLICAAFDLAEGASVDGRQGSATYAFPQFLAGILRLRRIDGFLVPGVRGNGDQAYSNLVVFRPLRRWHTWSCHEAGFARDV